MYLCVSELKQTKKYEINDDGFFYYCDTEQHSDAGVNEDFLMIIENMIHTLERLHIVKPSYILREELVHDDIWYVYEIEEQL